MTILRTMLAAIFLASLATSATHAAETAYFGVSNGASDQAFVIALSDPAKIAQARAIIADPQGQKGVIHVWGTVVTTPAKYNKPGPNADPWPFHLAPGSIHFFFAGPRLCDAATTAVANAVRAGNLKSVLPTMGWCPWASQVAVELKASDLDGGSMSPRDHGLPWPWGAAAKPMH